MQIDAKRIGLSGLILAGVLISGIASGDEHQSSDEASRGATDENGEAVRDEPGEPHEGRTAQPGADPHQRSIGSDPMPDQTREDGRKSLPPVSAKAGDASSYTVRSGDTLGSISERFLGNGNRWKEIAKANQIDDPEQLQVGTRLKIPQRADADPQSRPVGEPNATTDPQHGDADRKPGTGDERPGREDSKESDEKSLDRPDSTTERPGAGS